MPRWDRADCTFVADDALACGATSIRDIDEAVTRRQYGYASVDDYYVSRSSPLMNTHHDHSSPHT